MPNFRSKILAIAAGQESCKFENLPYQIFAGNSILRGSGAPHFSEMRTMFTLHTSSRLPVENDFQIKKGEKGVQGMKVCKNPQTSTTYVNY